MGRLHVGDYSGLGRRAASLPTDCGKPCLRSRATSVAKYCALPSIGIANVATLGKRRRHLARYSMRAGNFGADVQGRRVRPRSGR
jgi:hypothetical protein